MGDHMSYPFNCITDFIFVENEIIPCDIILIPGGSHPQLMEKAVDLLENGIAKYILPSGGKNNKIPDYPNEAEFLKSIAIKRGVSSERIICESKATNTYENALFSYELLLEKNIDITKVILVCKAYHSRRALFTYQKVFPANTTFYVSPVIDNRGITKENWFTKTEYIELIMREVEKMSKYFVDSILPMYERTL